MYTTLVNKKNKPKITIIKSSKKGEKKRSVYVNQHMPNKLL